jgi:hypothetical protein
MHEKEKVLQESVAWESEFCGKRSQALEETVGEKIVGTLETVTCNTRHSSTMGGCSMQNAKLCKAVWGRHRLLGKHRLLRQNTV